MQVSPVTRFILAAGAGIACFAGSLVVGRFLSGWDNEVNNTNEDNEATDGRATATKSNQDLNAQSEKLPKD